jgi:peptidoglycan/LPS O-acetylase OafA/YrhL
LVQDFSLIRVPPFGSMRPIWTIVVEWWLYIFFGVVFISVKFDLTWKKLTVAALFVMSLPVVFDHSFGGTGQGLALVWLFGAGYYLFVIERGLLRGRPWLNVSGLSFTILLIGFSRHIMAQSPHLYDLRYSIFVCCLIIFGAEVLRDFGARIICRLESIAKFLAKYSYSLYLVHFTIIVNLYVLADGAPTTTKIGYLVFGAALSNIIAYAFWWAFESKYKKVREIFSIRPKPLQPA